jgi:pimeloyl-ACP methyl ester carboxylesterase
MRHERAMIREVVRGNGLRDGVVFDEAALRGIDVPTLLIYGTADPTGSVAIWQSFVSALPRGRIEVVDGAGHMPWFDAPDAASAAVNRFVAESANG